MECLIDVATGRTEADLVIKNAKVVDVFNGRIVEGNVAICGGKIAGIGDYSAKNEYDAKGKYLMPSFCDAHVHIESSMVAPAEYASAVLPRGVTSVICDPHEIANVCGIDGILFMMENAKSAPFDFNFMLPSCVPATPFEDSGAIIDAEKVKEYIEKYDFLGLAEMMNYPGVVFEDKDVLRKIKSAKIVDGHAPGLSDKDLNAYASTGIMTEHECTSAKEVEEKLSVGMYALIRCGRLTKEFSQMVGAVNKYNSSRICFCTDDRNPQDIVSSGTIQYAIIKAVEAGMDVFDAIRAATINPSVCYGLKHKGAVAPGYFADLVLADDLCPENIVAVWKNGGLVAENGKITYEKSTPKSSYNVRNTVNIKDFSAEDLVCDFDKNKPVIEIVSGSLISKKSYFKTDEKLSHLAVIERHNKTGKIGRCYLANYGIKNGAVASCIGHDSHNVTVVGDSKEAMYKAVTALGKDGGIVVVKNGEVVGKLDLPIAGLMSDKSIYEVVEEHKKLELSIKGMNITPDIDPFMTLAFLSLPVIPELRLTARGLFDVAEFKFI